MKRNPSRDPDPVGRGAGKGAPRSIAGQRYPDQESSFSLILVVAIACAVYFNSMANQFVFDDRYFVIENPHIKALSHFPSIFTTGIMEGRGGPYRPLATASYAINYQLGGFNPVGYHLFNVILHGANTALLYLVIGQLFGSPSIALVSALLFAVHPIHTEAVTWVVGRTELLAAFFFLVAWLLYLRVSSSTPVRVRILVLSLLAFFLALLSKEHALMLPAILFLSDVYRASEARKDSRVPGEFFATCFRLYPAYLVVIACYFLMRWLLYTEPFLISPTTIHFVENPIAALPFYPRLLTAIKVWGRYFGLLAWPVHLSVDYSYDQIPAARSILEGEVLIPLGLIVTAMAVAFFSFWRKGRVWFCALFFFAMLMPTSNILTPIATIMAERVLYLPSVGVCIWAGVLWRRIWDWSGEAEVAGAARWAGFAVLGLILVLLGYRAVARNRDWRDEYTLWRSALQASPASAKVHLNFGVTLLQRGLVEEAVREYREALRIYPSYAHVHLMLGLAFLKKGDIDKAIQAYQDGLQIHPGDASLYINLGAAWMAKGRFGEAMAAYRQAIAAEPKSALAYYDLGNVLVTQGKLKDAVAAYQQAVALKPDYTEAFNNLSYTYLKLGDKGAAVAALQKALELKNSAEATAIIK